MVDKPPPSITFFSNTPGHRKGVTLGNGQLAINQADGVLETQTPSGVPRETILSPSSLTLQVRAEGGIGAGSVQDALRSLDGRIASVGSGSLAALTDVLLSSVATGQVLTWNGTKWANAAPAGGAVASGVAFTPSGNVAATTVQAAIQELDGGKAAISSLAAVATTGSYLSLSNRPTIPTNLSAFNNDSAFITTSGARNAISVTGSLAYNNATGVISYTAPALAAVATSGSAGDLTTGTLNSNRLPVTGVYPGNYGSGTQIPVVTVDATGRVVSIVSVPNQGPAASGLGSVNPTGSFAVNDIVGAATSDGLTIKSLGSAASLVRGQVSGSGGVSYASGTGVFSLSAPTSSILGGVFSASASANQFQTGISATGAPTFAQPSFANLSGTVSAAQLPLPTTTTKGGVQANAGSAGQFVNGINAATGALTYATPSAPPATSDGLTEGTANLYFTQARARASVSATGSLAYNSTTGVLSYTAPTALSAFTNDTAFISRTGISATGSLAYNSSTGVLSYTAPTVVSAFTNDSGYVTQAGARAAISATGSLAYNSTTGVLSYTQPTNVSAFTNDAAYVNQAGARSAISATGSLAYNSSTGVISYTAPTALSAAAASDVRTGTDTTKFVTASALMGAAAFVTDTWSATLTPDFSAGFNRIVTLGGNTTFGQPTNMKDGEPIVYRIIQDGTGSRTIAFSTTYWKFPGGTVPTASTTAGAIDRLTAIIVNRSGTLVCEVFGYDKDIK